MASCGPLLTRVFPLCRGIVTAVGRSSLVRDEMLTPITPSSFSISFLQASKPLRRTGGVWFGQRGNRHRKRGVACWRGTGADDSRQVTMSRIAQDEARFESPSFAARKLLLLAVRTRQMYSKSCGRTLAPTAAMMREDAWQLDANVRTSLLLFPPKRPSLFFPCGQVWLEADMKIPSFLSS